MLLDHVFESDNHSYYVPPPKLCVHGKGWVECGKHVGELPLSRKAICISDVIDLNGLTNHDAVPPQVLERASNRGNEFDAWVQAYLEGKDTPEVGEDTWACVKGFLAWASDHVVEIGAPLQKSMVWEYGEGSQSILLACTPDWPLVIDGKLTVVDGKTIHPLSGAAYGIKELAWRIQTQAQKEGLEEASELQEWHRAVLHCHPKLTTGARKRSDHIEYGEGFRFVSFPQDDYGLLTSAVHMAQVKLEAGLKINRR